MLLWLPSVVVAAAGVSFDDNSADPAVLLAHRSQITRYASAEQGRAAVRIWRKHHKRLMQDADNTDVKLDAFIDAQQDSKDACSSRLLESKGALDGLIHDLKSLTDQVNSHQEVLETEQENLQVTQLSIKAAMTIFRGKIRTCKKERERAMADFTQYMGELQELEQIAKPSVKSNITDIPLATPASLLAEETWTQEKCSAFVRFANQHVKKQRESAFQYTYQVPTCTGPAECVGKDEATCMSLGKCKWKGKRSFFPKCAGPPECIGKDKVTCKRMQQQEGKCKWKMPKVRRRPPKVPKPVEVPELVVDHVKTPKPVVVEAEETDAENDPNVIDVPDVDAEVTVDPDADFPMSIEQPFGDEAAEKQGEKDDDEEDEQEDEEEEDDRIEKDITPFDEGALGETLQNVSTLTCNQQRNKLQRIFTKAYLAVKDLKRDAKERSEDDSCFDTAKIEKAGKLVPLVAQRDQAAARIEYSSQALSALTPVLGLVKQRVDALQIHIAQVLTPECTEADVVSKYLQQVRDLIVSLEECPGRNNFKLKIPTEDTTTEKL